MAGKRLSRKKRSEMAGPSRHVICVVSSSDNIQQMPVVDPGIRRDGEEPSQIRVWSDGTCCTEKGIHVVRKKENAPIRPCIKLHIMLRAVSSITITRA